MSKLNACRNFLVLQITNRAGLKKQKLSLSQVSVIISRKIYKETFWLGFYCTCYTSRIALFILELRESVEDLARQLCTGGRLAWVSCMAFVLSVFLQISTLSPGRVRYYQHGRPCLACSLTNRSLIIVHWLN